MRRFERRRIRSFCFSFLFFFHFFFFCTYHFARTATKIPPVIAKIRGAAASVKIGAIKLPVIFFFSFFLSFLFFFFHGSLMVKFRTRIRTISTGENGTEEEHYRQKLGKGKEKRFPHRERESVSIDLPPGYRFQAW